MNRRFCISSGVLSAAILTILLVPKFLAAQAVSPGAKPAPKTTPSTNGAAKTQTRSAGTFPRTPDGRPDLHGYWTNLSFTPLERPAKYQGREFLTDKEMEEVYKAGLQVTYEGTPAEGIEGFGELYNPASVDYDVNTYALSPWQNGIRPNRRSSLVVDPPDGRIPPLTPEAKARPGQRRGFSYVEDDHHGGGIVHADVPWDLGTNTTCISMNSGPPILPAEYNSNLLIVQSAGYVAIEREVGSEVRIIPIDDRPHVAANIHQWHGDARGQWEGDTLVVETANFRPEATFRNANPKTFKVAERFTRIDKDTIEYKFTIDDPTTWTKPWSAIVPLSHVNGPLFEYDCSENNNDAVNILAGARAAEKAAEDKAKGAASVPISQK
jgi:hypothetical protein